ncbi:hypothetical protein [Streptomyces rapamycinicus]|uniref:Secreted protein n=1 Tax=Streptomyces rapamycinicus TaxID=1226757 RepID=A0ABR6LH56_9ACTN|nr:hypothetical protein [Streptomyces rapamycinicus]MBB4781603.1 hypothetical protein [Streptomyces rapamycinicus]UTO62190.1 hypothetical protein LJB45_07635 [Streptomyces rapamycinicus]UTP30142.1 hypothetical protein LIV37_12750 [Streptomyces rapamycinicus NRRL 5491]
MPAFFPVLIVSLFAMSSTGTPLFFSAMAKVSMSPSMTFGRPPWLPFASAVTCPSRTTKPLSQVQQREASGAQDASCEGYEAS